MLHALRSVAVVAITALAFTTAHAFDEDAAKRLARRNFCFKCHAVWRDVKDGPAYKKIAEKYKDKANAEARLIEHLTSGEKAKFRDGEEDVHKIIKTHPPNDTAQIKNLVQWILSL